MHATTPPAWLETLDAKLDTLRLRRDLFRTIRNFFEERNFLEVETPILVPCPGLEPHLKVFETQFEPEDPIFQPARFFLATSPEYAMKKLLAANSGDIFQICKCFRNGEFIGKHNPEFTMLEWYRVHATFENLIHDIEKLFEITSKQFGLTLSTQPPFKRFSMIYLFKEHFDLDLSKDIAVGDFYNVLEEKGMRFTESPDSLTWSDLFTRAFIEHIEPTLPDNEPYFLIEYPKPAAALAQISLNGTGEYAERFEFYFGKLELANGWTELRDAHEQTLRFNVDLKERAQLYPKEAPLPIDQDFLKALAFLPPCAGVAMGLDRLALALFQKKSIEDVLAFPTHTFPPYAKDER